MKFTIKYAFRFSISTNVSAVVLVKDYGRLQSLCVVRKCFCHYILVMITALLSAGSVSAAVYTRNSDCNQDHNTKPKLSCYEHPTGRGSPI